MFSVSQEISHFYGTQCLSAVMSRARHLSLFWPASIQTMPHPSSWRSILLLFSHLRLFTAKSNAKYRFALSPYKFFFNSIKNTCDLLAEISGSCIKWCWLCSHTRCLRGRHSDIIFSRKLKSLQVDWPLVSGCTYQVSWQIKNCNGGQTRTDWHPEMTIK